MLNFHEQELTLFLKSGHYDVLYSRDFIRSYPAMTKTMDTVLEHFYRDYESTLLKIEPI